MSSWDEPDVLLFEIILEVVEEIQLRISIKA